jgi:predicted MFS family arabinose efflux permease
MQQTHRQSASLITALLSFVLVANLVPLMTVPTVLPELQSHWHLSAGQAGWIGSIYFAGYAIAAPILTSLSDRIDGRWVLAGSSLVGAAASIAFGLFADGFWPALALRFASGVAMAGIHMPGLKMLAERTHGPAQLRSAGIYTSSYALGNAGSSLIAGVVDSLFDWQAPFVVSGIVTLLALPALALVQSVPKHAATEEKTAHPVSLRHNRPLIAYIVAFAGNTWEVFAIRVWFVACLAWTLQLPGNDIALPNLGVVSGLAALAGVPVSIAIAELAVRYRRSTVIVLTCLVSVAVCLGLAATAGGNVFVVLALLVLLQVTSFADVGALGAGAVASTQAAERSGSMRRWALPAASSGPQSSASCSSVSAAPKVPTPGRPHSSSWAWAPPSLPRLPGLPDRMSDRRPDAEVVNPVGDMSKSDLEPESQRVRRVALREIGIVGNESLGRLHQ